jgi:hypothetical protein
MLKFGDKEEFAINHLSLECATPDYKPKHGALETHSFMTYN